MPLEEGETFAVALEGTMRGLLKEGGALAWSKLRFGGSLEKIVEVGRRSSSILCVMSLCPPFVPPPG